MLAGGETTSAAVVWSLHLLGGHPEVLAAVHAETDAVLEGDVAGWEHLPRLELTARVVREALRLYPPAWAIPRICVRETRLADRTLPPGAMVVFSPYVLHRRPDLYPQPHRFDPGRWVIRDAQAAHRGAFLPFGAGATRCIGEEFGLTEAVLVLASITARWNLSLRRGATVVPAARAVLVPKAFPVYLSRRR
jgi:pentalenene oxygenase